METIYQKNTGSVDGFVSGRTWKTTANMERAWRLDNEAKGKSCKDL